MRAEEYHNNITAVKPRTFPYARPKVPPPPLASAPAWFNAHFCVEPNDPYRIAHHGGGFAICGGCYGMGNGIAWPIAGTTICLPDGSEIALARIEIFEPNTGRLNVSTVALPVAYTPADVQAAVDEGRVAGMNFQPGTEGEVEYYCELFAEALDGLVRPLTGPAAKATH